MINFKGQPLFGPDSSPQNTSKVLSLAFTTFLWLLFFILMIFIKPLPKKPKYKEIQIQLVQNQPHQKVEEKTQSAVPAKAASKNPEITKTEKSASEKKPAQNKLTESNSVEKKAPPVKNQSKSPAAKSQNAEASTTEYALDPMEAFNRQTAKKTAKEFDWSQFEEADLEENQTFSDSSKVLSKDSGFEGQAGFAQKESSQNAISSTSSNARNSSQTEKSDQLSSETSSALANISRQTYIGKAVNGVESSTNINAASSSGKVLIQMSNGSGRALLDPESPLINLSEEAAGTVDGSRTVKIRFKVVEAGNVSRSGITITPESVLSQKVREEIIDQISRWRFEAADYTATAEFEYKIVKW